MDAIGPPSLAAMVNTASSFVDAAVDRPGRQHHLAAPRRTSEMLRRSSHGALGRLRGPAA